jgi:urea transport system ATP-binding protein
VLELVDVDAFYGNSRALQGVSMRIRDKELLSVLGRNGVGKTTLLRTIIGLMDRVSGALRLDDQDIAAVPADERAKFGIAYVPQGRGILPKFTVRENLYLGLFARRNQATVIDDFIFELFPMLKAHLNRLGGNLSGGQQQQLSIARALLTEPKIILLDEPTEGIQPSIVEEIENVILKLNREHGIAVILVEQNVAFARRASQRFVIMERGTVAVQGDIGELTDFLVQKHMTV